VTIKKIKTINWIHFCLLLSWSTY